MDVKSLFETDNPVYVLGYGSLMYPSGINGRGMQYIYADDDLCICTVNGWERGMTAKLGKYRYYGIYPNDDSMINGVLFQIHSLYDIHMLNKSEGTQGATGEPLKYEPGTYKLTEIDIDTIECDQLPDNAIVLGYVIYDIPIGGVDAPNYCDYVDKGIEMWGQEFVDVFNATSTNKF